MRWLGWSFLFVACACAGAAALQSLYGQTLTLLPLDEVVTAVSKTPAQILAVGQVPLALPPLAVGLGLLVRGSRKPVRIFGPKRRFLWN
jgi:hypothetical protein